MALVPTTAWDDLSVAQAVQYGVPFIDPNTFQPVVDANNFAFKSGAGTNGTGTLSLANSGDLSGTDAINLGCQGDSYVPTTLQDQNTVGKVPGWSVSVSRGTRLIPTITQDADFAGEHSAYAYLTPALGQAPAYAKISGFTHYVKGADANNNLGGELRLGTKKDSGVYTEWLKLTNAGILAPLLAGGVALGAANFGFSRLTLDYTISAVIGAVVINRPTGAGNIAAGASTVVITNNLVSINSLVIAWLMGNDATLTSIKSVIPAAGSFTIAGNANATANLKVGFLVINTDS